MPIRAILLKQLELSYGALFRNLEGITNEESLIAPAEGGNSLNWVLGHIVASRNRMMSRLGLAPVWQMDLAFHYSGHDETTWSRDTAMEFQSILTDLVRSQQELLNALEQMSDARLAAPDEKGNTLADAFTFFNFHEAYHGGQVAVLRRFVGKPGVIRPAPLRAVPELAP